MTTDTIAAVATPFGEGAIALLRVSGPAALAVAGRICRTSGAARNLENLPPRRVTRARLMAADGLAIDEALVTVFRAPASYTGEDLVEMACHGGILVTRRVLEALLAAGARPAGPGEFTQRAFLNGKLDLTQAEAVMDLIGAQSDLALRAAREQLDGRLGRHMHQLRDDLLGLTAHLEAYIDFPDEDIDPDTGAAFLARCDAAAATLDALLATAGQGRILREGVRTVIFGHPNVGKSSLLNALLGHDRAIVSEIPGTTRDTVEEWINVRGLPLRLIDTAGLRLTADPVEHAGVDRTRAALARADLALHLVDVSQPPPLAPDGDESFLGNPPATAAIMLHVLNKIDLGIDPAWSRLDNRAADRTPLAQVGVSCLTGEGLEALQDAIFAAVTGGQLAWNPGEVAINARHQHCLIRARESLAVARTALAGAMSPELVAVDLRAALDAIGEVVGGIDTEEILGRIFSTFCIGK